MEELLAGFPVRSVSFDNGAEFSEFRQLEEHLQAPIYFAEPHKPWQRGTNENTNGILRFFFPKGFYFRGLSPQQLLEAVDLINHRPKKCLNWKTPFEVFHLWVLHLLDNLAATPCMIYLLIKTGIGCSPRLA